MSAYSKSKALTALAATVIIGAQLCAVDAFAQNLKFDRTKTSTKVSSKGKANTAPIGKTVASKTLVNAYGRTGKRVLVPKSPIYSDDRLQANRTGNAQIILVDNTKIVVGPGAEVRIDDYVFDTDKTFSKIVVSVSKGTIRFISGKSKPSAYRFKTPTGTIGIRG
jgi:hypothetical protein